MSKTTSIDYSIRPLPKRGLEVDMRAFEEVRLQNGMQSLWYDKENRDNLLFGKDSLTSRYLARFVELRSTEDNAKSKYDIAIFEYRENGREYASTSVPIDPLRGVPVELKQDVERALMELQLKADDPKATEEAKEFINSIRLADPKSSPDMYRLYKVGKKERLLVLWGCNRKGATSCLPLDALQRLQTYRSRSILESVLLGLLSLAIGLMLLGLLLFFLWPNLPDVFNEPFRDDKPRVVVDDSSPEVDVVNIADDQPNAISFGTASVGDDVVKDFTVRNLGKGALALEKVQVPVGFLLEAGLPNTLAPNTSATFSIRMNTANAGERSGQVQFNNSDSDESPYNFQIAGTVKEPYEGDGPEVHVEGVVDGQAEAIFFGAAEVGEVIIKEFKVQNRGKMPLDLEPIQVPVGFSLVTALPRKLEPESSATLSVRMDTSSVGKRSGEILFKNNDADESPFNFPINGSVGSGNDFSPEIVVVGPAEAGITVASKPTEAPEVVVTGPDDTPVEDAQTDSVFFGSVSVGVFSVKKFTVRNVGNALLTLGQVKVPNGFSLEAELPKTLQPNSSATFIVRMDSTTAAKPSGEIQFTSNDADKSPFNFPIAGIVQALPEPELEVVGIEDGQLNAILFGEVAIGDATSKEFTVRNVGKATLKLGQVQVPYGFSLEAGLPKTLDQGSSAKFIIRMDTSTAGKRSGEVQFTSNDADESPFNFLITGMVQPPLLPEVEVVGIVDGQPNAISFGDAKVGEEVKREFTIRNIGTARLTLSQVEVPLGFSLEGKLPAALETAASTTFIVKMDTAKAGKRSGKVQFTCNDDDESPFNFQIVGTVEEFKPGEPQYIKVQPRSVEYGKDIKFSAKVEGIIEFYDRDGIKKFTLPLKGSVMGSELALDPGYRTLKLIPDDKKLKDESIDFVVYNRPIIDRTRVKIEMPSGLDTKGYVIAWGDGSEEQISKSKDVTLGHEYSSPGKYKIAIKPIPQKAWSAIAFEIEIQPAK